MVMGSVTAVLSLRIRLAGSWRRPFVCSGDGMEVGCDT
jgi:hypothetical protein